MKTVCLGRLCQKAKECKRYWANNQGECHTVDYSTDGEIDEYTIKYDCGDRGNYKLFEEK